MRDLTTTDKRLLATLKQDGRVSVTTLAATLKISRVTAQSRLDRLIQTGIIQRFTIDIDASVDDDGIRAIMLIELEGTLANMVTSALKNIPEIASLHTTNGNRQVREIKGVLNSETNILLNRATA